MNRYKSWSALNKQLTGFLCGELKGRISFFLTRYHKVHNSYGRAAIRLDGKELVCFSWIEMYHQEHDLHEVWEKTGIWDYESPDLKKKWDESAVYYDMDFLSAATSYLNMPIQEALTSSNYIIRIFAVLDRRVGKRTLQKIKGQKDFQSLPGWVKQFYNLRRQNMDSIWEKMYIAAKNVQNGRKISNYVDAGGVAAAVLASDGKIYTGVCVDTCSTLGICAERNAIFHMLTCGEHRIEKVLAIMPDGRTGAPCGACRELMVQLMPDSYREIEIMLDYEAGRVVTLGELTPEWWI